MFAKEHASFLFTPRILEKYILPSTGGEAVGSVSSNSTTPSFSLKIPESYGAPQTFSNETFLPDEYLLTWQPAFTIRHPALTFPSFYRAMVKLSGTGSMSPRDFDIGAGTSMTLRWSRILYDWYTEHGVTDIQKAPPVLDANDVIHSPQAVVIPFCERMGLDPSKLKVEWDITPEAPKGGDGAPPQASQAIMLSTLLGSSGVEKGKAPETVDIAAEAEKWKKEFGEEVAGKIERAVWAAMPDYEYLKTKRLGGGG